MTQALHWIIDPICGWSYGALPLINAVQAKYSQLQQLHFGGLYVGDSRQAMSADLRQRIVQYDQHIHQLTGVEFGDDYKNGLLHDTSLVLDSFPATHVLLAAQQHLDIAQQVELLNKIQTAYYQKGLNITQSTVLNELIETSGFGNLNDQWRTWLAKIIPQYVAEQIQQARKLMVNVHGQGFPTLVLARSPHERIKIDVPNYYRRPDKLLQYIDTQLN